MQTLEAIWCADPALWLPLLWVLLTLLASLLFRLSRGKPLLARPPERALFVERWRSGRNRSNWLGLFGGANNCLMVAASREQLIILPQFPFSLLFMPELFGLELRARTSDVIEARIETRRFGSVLLLRVRQPEGAEQVFELWLRDPAALIRLLPSGQGQ
jgi:hypothetical protein